MTARIKELRDQRNKLMHDAQTIALKTEKSSEERSSFKKMLDDVEVLDADILQEERFAKMSSSTQPAPPRGPVGVGEPDDEQRAMAAFDHYIRYGLNDMSREERSLLRAKVAQGKEARDLTTATGGAGAILVPPGYMKVLTQAKLAWGEILTVVNNLKTSGGESMIVPFINDTSNGLTVVGSGTPNVCVETDPAITSGTLGTDIVMTGMVRVGLPLIEDSAFNVEDWLDQALAARYYRGATYLVTNGDGSNVQSIIPTASGAQVAAQNSGTVAWKDLTDLYSAVDPAYLPNAMWAMNSTTKGTLLGTTDSLGRPLYVPAPSAEDFDQLLGKRVVMNQALPNVPTATNSGVVPIQFGDFKQGYTFREVADGLAVARANELFLCSLEVGFIGWARIGGILTDAGTHPIKNLVVSHS